MHAQAPSSTFWTETKIQQKDGTWININDAVAAWYFNNTATKLVDPPFPSNPTC